MYLMLFDELGTSSRVLNSVVAASHFQEIHDEVKLIASIDQQS